MEFFVFLIVLLVTLIIITIVTTIIKLALFATTKYKYETYLLIVPAILYIVLWGGLFIIWLLLCDKYSDNGFVNLIFSSIIDSNFNIINFREPIIIFVTCSLVGILLQPFVFLTVNIPYNSIRMRISIMLSKLKRWFILKILKKDLKPYSMPSYEIKLKEKWVNLKFPTALISSIFSFALIFLIIFILLFTSNIISKKILEKIHDEDYIESTQSIEENENNEITENAN